MLLPDEQLGLISSTHRHPILNNFFFSKIFYLVSIFSIIVFLIISIVNLIPVNENAIN